MACLPPLVSLGNRHCLATDEENDGVRGDREGWDESEVSRPPLRGRSGVFGPLPTRVLRTGGEIVGGIGTGTMNGSDILCGEVDPRPHLLCRTDRGWKRRRRSTSTTISSTSWLNSAFGARRSREARKGQVRLGGAPKAAHDVACLVRPNRPVLKRSVSVILGPVFRSKSSSRPGSRATRGTSSRAPGYCCERARSRAG